MSALGLSGLLVVGLSAFGSQDAHADGTSLKMRLESAMPNAEFGTVSCDLPIEGLCEVTSGNSILYVTEDARYAFAGHLLDIEGKRDLTEERLAAVSAFNEAAFGGVTPEPKAQTRQRAIAPRTPPPPQAPSQPIKLDLPESHAVVSNPDATGGTIYVFSDPNCGACQSFHSALQSIDDVRVVEYLMPFLSGSEQKARDILCAEDREGALHAGYTQGDVLPKGQCAEAEAIINANRAFAEANGINSTPTIFNAAGEKLTGPRSANIIRGFAK